MRTVVAGSQWRPLDGGTQSDLYNPRIAVEQVEGGGGIWPDYGKREDEGLG